MEFQEHIGGEVFTRFLDRIMEGKPQVANFLRRLIGYSLTELTIEQILVILWGQGSNGKTTLLEVIEEMMGDYAQHTPASTFMVQRGDQIRNDIARLQGARLVVATETETAKRLSESLVKSLTGGDSVTARFLHKEFFEFKPQFTPFLMTNHKPLIYGVDHAIWRRVKLIPFTVTIPDEEQDKELPEKLRKELPAILSWAVMGCLEWQQVGLKEPTEVTVATETYRSEMDILGEFFEECLRDPQDSRGSFQEAVRGLHRLVRAERREAPEPEMARPETFRTRFYQGHSLWRLLKVDGNGGKTTASTCQFSSNRSQGQQRSTEVAPRSTRCK